VAHLRGNIVHRCLFHKFHCDCFCSDIEGVQNKVMCLRIETTYSMNVTSTWRLRVGFACRLCRLNPRASRSKGAPTNCGRHRVNGRYIISQIKLRQNLCLNYYSRNLVVFNFRVITPESSNEFPWISIWRSIWLFSECWPAGSLQLSFSWLKPLVTSLHLIKARLHCW